MTKLICSEVLFYDGDGNYIMLDFNPYRLSKNTIINKAVKELKAKYGLEKDYILDHLYLLPDNSLILVKEMKK